MTYFFPQGMLRNSNKQINPNWIAFMGVVLRFFPQLPVDEDYNDVGGSDKRAKMDVGIEVADYMNSDAEMSEVVWEEGLYK